MIHKFLQDSLVYAIPTVLTRGIGLILLPIYARNLAPFEYGVVEILTIAYVLLNLLLPLEVSQAVARFSAEARQPQEKNLYVSTAISFTALAFLAFVVVAWTTPVSVPSAALGSEPAAQALPLASLWMAVNALFYIVLNQLRWDRQSRAYAATSVVFTLATAAVSVVLIAVFKFGITGYLWGQLAGSLAGLAMGLGNLRKTTRVSLSLDISELKRMVEFSAPLIISSLAVYLTLYIDRWLLFAWRGAAELGVYAVGYRIASVVTLAVTVVQLALTPMIYSHYRDAETPAALRKIFRYFLLATFSLVVLVAAFAAEIVSLFAGQQYLAASLAVPWLCVGTVLANIYIFAPGLILAKKTKAIALISATSAAINLAANAVLIPSMGIVGAALGMMIASSVAAGLYFRSSERHFRISYEWRRCSMALLGVAAFLLILQLQEPALAWRALLWLVACGAMGWILTDRADFRWLDNRFSDLRSR